VLSSSLDRGVLVVTVHHDPGTEGRAELLAQLEGLVQAHRPTPVVVILEEPATDGAVVSVVLRLHRTCRDLGVLMSVVSTSAPIRRMLEADADSTGTHLVIHARTDTAVTAAFAAAA
jgi:hypothetical protein